MASSFIERQMENAMRNMFDEKGARLVRFVSKIAAKQGGETAIENYQLLGKRVLTTVGIAVVVVEATVSAIGFIVSRKSEQQRMERVARRVFEEERLKAEAGTEVEVSAKA